MTFYNISVCSCLTITFEMVTHYLNLVDKHTNFLCQYTWPNNNNEGHNWLVFSFFGNSNSTKLTTPYIFFYQLKG